MAKIYFTILVCFLLSSCHKKHKEQKKILLIATDESSFADKTEMTLKIFYDSSYVFKVSINGELYSKVEVFKGVVKIKNDSLDFFPSSFQFTMAEKASIKNGYIDFFVWEPAF